MSDASRMLHVEGVRHVSSGRHQANDLKSAADWCPITSVWIWLNRNLVAHQGYTMPTPENISGKSTVSVKECTAYLEGSWSVSMHCSQTDTASAWAIIEQCLTRLALLRSSRFCLTIVVSSILGTTCMSQVARCPRTKAEQRYIWWLLATDEFDNLNKQALNHTPTQTPWAEPQHLVWKQQSTLIWTCFPQIQFQHLLKTPHSNPLKNNVQSSSPLLIP